jgi:hypothetical protein
MTWGEAPVRVRKAFAKAVLHDADQWDSPGNMSQDKLP